MSIPVRILILDNDQEQILDLVAELHQAGFELDWLSVATETDYLTQIGRQWDVILAEHSSTGFSALHALSLLHASGLEIPIVVLAEGATEEAAAAYWEAGAADVLSGHRLARLGPTVMQTLEYKKLRGERDRTRAILEAVGEAVVVTDVDGNIEYVNPAAVSLTGLTSEEAGGKPWSVWQGQTLIEGYHRLMEEVKCSGQNCRGEVVHQRGDGSLRDLAVTVAPLVEADDGELAGFVSVERDVTPIKAAERMKDGFVSNVSHELRTPVSVITLVSGNLDRLYDRLDDQKRRQMIQEIREQARVLNDLIRDILETSRIDSQRLSMERQILNLAQVVASEVEKQLPLAQQKGQSLDLEVPPDLTVWGNEGQLKQAICNVLNNAIKYTPPGGQVVCKGLETEESAVPASERGERTLEARTDGNQASPQERWIALHISDNGPGIGKEDLRLVFNRFYRADNQREVPGTGLGLSIAQELVELHGGRLTVTSTPGKGSTFTILLPMWKRRDREHEGQWGTGAK